MPTLSSGINIALQAVMSQSQAIEIIGHNVANVDTEGYHRQNAVLSATSMNNLGMITSIYGTKQLGTGVIVDSVNRFTLDFFDGRYRSISAECKSWESQGEIFTQMETILSDLSDEGLSQQMDTFFLDWQNVAGDPTNTSLRAELITNATSLCEKFNTNASQLIALQEDQNLAVGNLVEEINTLAQSVANLNSEISRVYSLGQQPNDLLDQRDLALDHLANLTGATSSTQDNGEVIVSVGGHVLVNGQSALTLSTEPDPENTSVDRIVWDTDSAAFSPVSGELEGILKVRDYYIPEYLSKLNEFAETIVEQVNTLHSGGYCLDGSAGGNFFVTGTNALDIAVNPDLKPENIAASGTAVEIGNSDIATKIFSLREKNLMGSATQTLSEFFNVMIIDLATATQQTEDNSGQYKTVLDALATQRESATGVSLDEEAASLTTAQKAYEAAARIMTAYDELLDIVINNMGLVGR